MINSQLVSKKSIENLILHLEKESDSSLKINTLVV